MELVIIFHVCLQKISNIINSSDICKSNNLTSKKGSENNFVKVVMQMILYYGHSCKSRLCVWGLAAILAGCGQDSWNDSHVLLKFANGKIAIIFPKAIQKKKKLEK